MANFNLNKVILGGRLTAKPELKQTPAGAMVTSFTVAVTRRFGEKQAEGAVKAIADFINVTAWRKNAELVCRYFDKGSSICVVGSIQTRTWEDKQGNKRYATEVVADEIHFVDSKGNSVPIPSDADAPPVRGGSGASESVSAAYGTSGGNVPQFETVTDDDELPFLSHY
ncbi:MAG: single-stranded DNA-binding protein [Clostridia bacterium]|nr:single-stranded DNA-binding protein [Clostridia bacterium]